jgi:tight adherence protein C
MEIENFVATIVQADQLGVSIAKVLRTQAEQMRIFRRQRAEEQARQATIKLLFPLVFMIFPALLAVLLGPAIPQIIDTLGSL